MAPNPKFQLRRILYATDFLQPAVAALPLAAYLARTAEALLYLAHVIEVHPWDTSPELAFQNRLDATKLLDLALEAPTLRGLRTETVVRHGGAATQLLRIAQDYQADLVVTGTRVRHGLFTSSVAAKLAQTAPCPVMAVTPQTTPPIDGFRNIVVATGLNPGAAAGISYARSFAQAHGARLWVAHPLRPQETLAELIAVQRWLEKLAPDQPGVARVMEEGSVEDVTVTLANRESADLVMLAPGLGSLLPHMVRHLPCPVMAVRYAIPMIRPKTMGAEPAISS